MKKKVFLSVLVTLLAVSLMAACGEQKEIMEIETVSVSEEQEIESVSSGEEPVKEEEMVPEEQEAEQKTEAEEEPVVEPEPEPVVEPEPEIVTPPSSSSLPYIKDGMIYLDVREDPEAMEEALFFLEVKFHGKDAEYKEKRRKMYGYGKYMPQIGELTTYFPLIDDGYTYTGPMYDGGTFYIHHDEQMEENLWRNLTLMLTGADDSFPGSMSVTLDYNNDIPHEDGMHYVGGWNDGKMIYAIRYYVYYVD